MTTDRHIQNFTKLLFAPPEAEDPVEVFVFAILDGASVPGLTEKLDACDIEASCLYRGELDPDTAIRAPYLVKFSQVSDGFLRWILEDLNGQPWGVFATISPPISFEAARRHFRRLIKVKSPEGETWLFRYYDPRVLRVYLPTCLPDEWEFVYGPVNHFFAGTPGGSAYDCFSYSARTGFTISTTDIS